MTCFLLILSCCSKLFYLYVWRSRVNLTRVMCHSYPAGCRLFIFHTYIQRLPVLIIILLTSNDGNQIYKFDGVIFAIFVAWSYNGQRTTNPSFMRSVCSCLKCIFVIFSFLWCRDYAGWCSIMMPDLLTCLHAVAYWYCYTHIVWSSTLSEGIPIMLY